MSRDELTHPLIRLLARLPLVGYVGRCIEEERHGELALFWSNVLMAAVVGTLLLGYPFAITVALCAAAVAALVILSATVG